MATAANYIYQKLQIKRSGFQLKVRPFYHLLANYLIDPISATTVRRDTRTFTNVAPTIPGMV